MSDLEKCKKELEEAKARLKKLMEEQEAAKQNEAKTAEEKAKAAEERRQRILSLDGLICGIDRQTVWPDPVRERSPRRRFRSGAIAPEKVGNVAPFGAYIKRYLREFLPAPVVELAEESSKVCE